MVVILLLLALFCYRLWHLLALLCTYMRTICNNVAKIIYIVLHFVLCKVLSLLKQNTK